MNEQFTAPTGADHEVIAPISIEIRPGHPRAELAQAIGQQRLVSEIVER